jgi:hypothetical protein
MSDISFPNMGYFLAALAVAALAALSTVVSLGFLAWASMSGKPVAKRRAAFAAALSASLMVLAGGAVVLLD